jgi:hypothetical protein
MTKSPRFSLAFDAGLPDHAGMAARRSTIIERWDISVEEPTAAIDANPSLRGMLFGYVAEPHLRKMWFEGCPGVTSLIKYDDHDREKKGDPVITYIEHPFKVESKSLQTAADRKVGTPNEHQGPVIRTADAAG